LPDKKDISLGLVSSDGKFKRISINEITDISNRSTTILKLKDDIKLKSCILCEENSYLLIISDIGRIIKILITENDFPCMGKLAQGTNIMKLFPGEKIIKVLNINEKQFQDLVLITNKCSFVKHNTKDINISKKGELGSMLINFIDNKKFRDRLIDCFIKNQYIYIKTNKERYEKLDLDRINQESYKKEQKLNIKLNKDEIIKSVFSIILPENS